jgi:predicted transcriptional regulator
MKLHANKTTVIHLRLPQDLAGNLMSFARADRRTRTQYIKNVLDDHARNRAKDERIFAAGKRKPAPEKKP